MISYFMNLKYPCNLETLKTIIDIAKDDRKWKPCYKTSTIWWYGINMHIVDGCHFHI
jgi:hypothetical protein